LRRGTFCHDPPSAGVLLDYLQTPPGEIVRNRFDFFPGGAMPLEELFW
jgi:hypothetical protein